MSKCWRCGEAADKHENMYRINPKWEGYVDYFSGNERYYDEIHQREFCEKCFEEYKAEREADKKEYIRLKKKLMYERAVRIAERQNIDIYEYQEALEAVKEFSEENPDKFDSAHEMLAAAMFIYYEVQAKTQHKVGKYRVDFLLPDLKTVFEVDGDSHKHTLFYDNQRDEEIRSILGKEWEVVRISTKYIEENVELLVEAIKTIKSEKQKIRRENYGILPEWYSNRQKARKPKKIKATGDDLLLED